MSAARFLFLFPAAKKKRIQYKQKTGIIDAEQNREDKEGRDPGQNKIIAGNCFHGSPLRFISRNMISLTDLLLHSRERSDGFKGVLIIFQPAAG